MGAQISVPGAGQRGPGVRVWKSPAWNDSRLRRGPASQGTSYSPALWKEAVRSSSGSRGGLKPGQGDPELAGTLETKWDRPKSGSRGERPGGEEAA